MFRTPRIAVLLFIPPLRAIGAWRSHAQATGLGRLSMTIYPIAADDSCQLHQAVAQLRADDLPLRRVASGGGAAPRLPGAAPGGFNLALLVDALPPPTARRQQPVDGLVEPLAAPGHGGIDAAPGPRPQIRLFVLYHDRPCSNTPRPREGKIGVIKAFASCRAPAHLVIVAHELPPHPRCHGQVRLLATNQPHPGRLCRARPAAPATPAPRRDQAAGRIPERAGGADPGQPAAT